MESRKGPASTPDCPGTSRPETPSLTALYPLHPSPTLKVRGGGLSSRSVSPEEVADAISVVASESVWPSDRYTDAQLSPNTPTDVPDVEPHMALLKLNLGRGRSRSPTPEGASAVSTPSTGSDIFISSSLARQRQVPNWMAMDFGPLPKSVSDEEQRPFEPPRPNEKPSRDPPGWPTIPPPPHVFSKDTSCWVAQGRADPSKFRSVSRVQRLINERVYQMWGFYMPYAPEWVFDEVERLLDEWLYGVLIRREGLTPGGLLHQNATKRNQDAEYLANLAREWWFGRTILKHGVRSCGKFQKDRTFALLSNLPSGAKIDKPHPAYYVAFKVTKDKYDRNLH
ncbi:hypothetical protein XENTR_v10024691 [Xenopus tropicalis]|nr:hypothetical protein XENTR_v10024691 [Xenopus tropicalis]